MGGVKQGEWEHLANLLEPKKIPVSDAPDLNPSGAVFCFSGFGLGVRFKFGTPQHLTHTFPQADTSYLSSVICLGLLLNKTVNVYATYEPGHHT